jgi:hypothetical protein
VGSSAFRGARKNSVAATVWMKEEKKEDHVKRKEGIEMQRNAELQSTEE